MEEALIIMNLKLETLSNKESLSTIEKIDFEMTKMVRDTYKNQKKYLPEKDQLDELKDKRDQIYNELDELSNELYELSNKLYELKDQIYKLENKLSDNKYTIQCKTDKRLLNIAKIINE